jgi:hypothetical protein
VKHFQLVEELTLTNDSHEYSNDQRSPRDGFAAGWRLKSLLQTEQRELKEVRYDQ